MSQKLKIFFISNLGYGSSGLQRKTALQDLGHVITPFDWAVYKGRIENYTLAERQDGDGKSHSVFEC